MKLLSPLALQKKFPVGLGIVYGILITVLLPIMSHNILGQIAPTEELNPTNGTIKTYQNEIARLRRIIQNGECKNPAALTAIEETCTVQDDCKNMDTVCKDSVCVPLIKPLCSCMQGNTNAYILCVSENGQGKEARTISCGTNACNSSPSPHCAQ